MENTNEKDSINIRIELEKYLIYWKWFAISCFVFTTIAVIYAKSQVNVYKTQASILVKEESGAATELQAFQDLSSLGLSNSSNILDEIEILKSRTLTIKTIEKLNLNYALFTKKGLKNVEVFNNKPIDVEILSDKQTLHKLDTIIGITILNQNEFAYEIEGEGEVKNANFGDKIEIDGNVLSFNNQNLKFDELNQWEYTAVFKNLDNVLEDYQQAIDIDVLEDSNIISLVYKYPVKAKAQLILNTLIKLYNYISVEDKNIVGKKTNEFIEERLVGIKLELDEIDRLEENYKKNENISDIRMQSEVFIDGKSNNELEYFKKSTELSVVNYMIKNIEQQVEDFDLLPTNIAAENNIELSKSVGNYNKILLERNTLLKNSSLEHPSIQDRNSQLRNLRLNIYETLKNTKEQLDITISSLDKKEKEFESRIKEMPKQIREYRTILRRQTIIAELYTYLLQKREENKITMAVTVADTKIIDSAYSMYKPVAPNKKLIAFIGLVVGFLIPFLVVYIQDTIDTKFHTRVELERHVTIPILGDIPFDKSDEKVIIKQGSRTSSAEAFRLLRTNMDFMLSGVQNKTKVIFVTSTVSGEGKTFVSVNTASSLALTGKKVLLIGMDLRAPKITQYLALPNRSGVSNYLIGQENNISKLVFPLPGFENLDVLSSGIVPPNPAELLLNVRLENMFEELRNQYDYIIVDTAPVNLVTDTLMMSKYADMFVYVARANYLDKRLLELSQKLYDEKRLPNMTMLINGMDHEKAYGYGVYGYGYPDEHEKKNFFQRIFKL